MDITLSKTAHSQLKKRAKAAFPVEIYGICLGKVAGKSISIETVYIPPDLALFCTDSQISPPEHWSEAAAEMARRLNCRIVGDIHSHCYKPPTYCRDTAPSQGDWDSARYLKATIYKNKIACHGIVTVTESKRGKEVHFGFWPILDKTPIVVK